MGGGKGKGERGLGLAGELPLLLLDCSGWQGGRQQDQQHGHHRQEESLTLGSIAVLGVVRQSSYLTCPARLAHALCTYVHRRCVQSISVPSPFCNIYILGIPATLKFYPNQHIIISRKIVEGTRGLFYTIGRSSLPTAETLRRRRRRKKNMIPKAQHRFCTMV